MFFYHEDSDIKTKYNPSNRLHLVSNSEIKKNWVKDPNYLEAYRSIINHYREMLDTQYGGDLNKVPKAIIDKDTAGFIESEKVSSLECNK
jgi:hypothetical protein